MFPKRRHVLPLQGERAGARASVLLISTDITFLRISKEPKSGASTHYLKIPATYTISLTVHGQICSM
jgi:hypothetical protein